MEKVDYFKQEEENIQDLFTLKSGAFGNFLTISTRINKKWDKIANQM